MVNEKDVADRLAQIMAHYQLTASAFAERIEVQRSGISHILSGRNKPSLDFVLKVVRAFPEVDLYWLLNGRGEFPAQSTNKAQLHAKEAPIPNGEKSIQRIILIYEDNSFEVLTQKSG